MGHYPPEDREEHPTSREPPADHLAADDLEAIREVVGPAVAAHIAAPRTIRFSSQTLDYAAVRPSSTPSRRPLQQEEALLRRLARHREGLGPYKEARLGFRRPPLPDLW